MQTSTTSYVCTYSGKLHMRYYGIAIQGCNQNYIKGNSKFNRSLAQYRHKFDSPPDKTLGNKQVNKKVNKQAIIKIIKNLKKK